MSIKEIAQSGHQVSVSIGDNNLKEFLADIQKEHDAEVAALKQEFDEDEKFISAKVAARVLNVSSITIWRWTKSGLVKGIKVGNLIRYSLSEMNYLKKGGEET